MLCVFWGLQVWWGCQGLCYRDAPVVAAVVRARRREGGSKEIIHRIRGILERRSAFKVGYRRRGCGDAYVAVDGGGEDGHRGCGFVKWASLRGGTTRGRKVWKLDNILASLNTRIYRRQDASRFAGLWIAVMRGSPPSIDGYNCHIGKVFLYF